MDFSSSTDNGPSDIGQVSDEPEVINETFDDLEPEFTETVQTPTTTDDTVIDQTPPVADDHSNHAMLDGIEVPGSPETESLEIPVTRDWGMHGEGPSGGIEGGY